MTRWYKAANKRMIARAGNGRFRQTTAKDVLGFEPGYCEKHHHFTTPRPVSVNGFVDPASMAPVCEDCERERGESLTEGGK